MGHAVGEHIDEGTLRPSGLGVKKSQREAAPANEALRRSFMNIIRSNPLSANRTQAFS
jgi:hypothetical protein